MEKKYLVDYENTGESCFEVIRKNGICEIDEVIIFYSDKAYKADLHEVSKIAEAKVSFIKVNSGQTDALDFCLVFHLGKLMGANKTSHEYIIVSQDKDYDGVVKQLLNDNISIKKIYEEEVKYEEEKDERKSLRKAGYITYYDVEQAIKKSKYPIKDVEKMKELIDDCLRREKDKKKFESLFRSKTSLIIMHEIEEGITGNKKKRKEERKKVNEEFIKAMYKQVPYRR